MARATAKRQKKQPEGIFTHTRVTAALFVAILCFLSLVCLRNYLPYVAAYMKLLLGIISMIAAGISIKYILDVPGAYGFFVIRTKSGINFIDNLTKKYLKQWQWIVDWGFVVSFGLLTYIFFRKYVSKKMLALGIVSIILINLFVFPFLAQATNIIAIPQFNSQSTAATYTPSAGVINYISIIFPVISVVGGFIFWFIGELILIVLLFLHGLFISLVAIATPAPAGLVKAPIPQLPGPAGYPIFLAAILKPEILLPLVLAIIFVITLHEFSHGVMIRKNKLVIKALGLPVFGIIPPGAFVEPDEKQVRKLPRIEQDKISIAGVSFNFFLAMVSCVLFAAVIYLVLPYVTANYVYISGTVPGSPSQNVIPPGSLLYSWNNQQVHSIADLQAAAANDMPFSTVTLATNNGSYAIRANATGKIGVYLGEESVPINNGILATAAQFLYDFFGLSLLLNFYIAVFNILPVPLFDGFRIYNNRIRPRYIKWIAILFIIIIILLFLPWAWSL